MEARVLAQDELEHAWGVLEQAFGGAPHPDDRKVELGLVDPTRTLGAFDGERLVGTAASFAMRMTFPGARRDIGFVTWVGVSPTYRRQGVLTSLMARQLADLHDRGEAVAALWASEGAIYPRYGYGLATARYALTIPKGAAFARPVPAGRLSLVGPDQALLSQAYDGVAAVTAGWTARDDAWWAYRLHDPEHRRGGAGPLQCVIDDQTGSYALYCTKGEWADTGPAGLVTVREVVSNTPAATARLWRHLLDLDLMAKITYWSGALDDPLLQLLAEPRSAAPSWRDGLYVRLVDVGAALSSRALDTEVDVVLDITDARCPWNAGRWRLCGSRDGATCTTTTGAADLRLDVEDLGAAFLGGTSLLSRAASGRVEELSRGALVPDSRALGWTGPAPSCPMIF